MVFVNSQNLPVLIDTIEKAFVAYTFAATVMEPPGKHLPKINEYKSEIKTST